MLIFGCNDLLSAHKIRDLWVFNFTETMLQFTAILPFNLVVFLQKKSGQNNWPLLVVNQENLHYFTTIFLLKFPVEVLIFTM